MKSVSSALTYQEFLINKAIVDTPSGIKSPRGINKKLYPFQVECVKWALIRGRAALFEGTGLGKTGQQCEWAKHVESYTSKPVLIVAPLAVSHQTIAEASNLLGMKILFAHSQDNIAPRGVFITNYQKIDKFDMRSLGGIVLDESSILKSQDGATKTKLIEECSVVPFRLACTATPAPNDYMELGNHAEWLGVMTSTEMLSTFFVHDGGETQKWRLKRHAEQDFWKWMASWSICITHPRDIGFDQEGYDLPELKMHEVIVDINAKPLDGELFAMPARTMMERKGARRISTSERVEKCKEIIESNGDGTPWLIWAGLNEESKLLASACEAHEITGSDTDLKKETSATSFAKGEIDRLASKVTIFGYGMNWQVCHNVIFCGLSDSFEQIFQAVRRCWRFGQKHPVNVWIVISSQEGAVLKNIKRKESDSVAMQKSLVGHMANFTKAQLTTKAARQTIEYKPCKKILLPSFLK